MLQVIISRPHFKFGVFYVHAGSMPEQMFYHMGFIKLALKMLAQWALETPCFPDMISSGVFVQI